MDTTKKNNDGQLTLHCLMLLANNYMQAQRIWNTIEPINTRKVVKVQIHKMDIASIFNGF